MTELLRVALWRASHLRICSVLGLHHAVRQERKDRPGR
jgi:hypothetical protein